MVKYKTNISVECSDYALTDGHNIFMCVGDCFDKFWTYMSFPITFSADLIMTLYNARIGVERLKYETA